MSYIEVDVAVGVQALKLSLKRAPGGDLVKLNGQKLRDEEIGEYLSGTKGLFRIGCMEFAANCNDLFEGTSNLLAELPSIAKQALHECIEKAGNCVSRVEPQLHDDYEDSDEESDYGDYDYSDEESDAHGKKMMDPIKDRSERKTVVDIK